MKGVTPHLFYLSDLICSLFFVNSVTVFSFGCHPLWRVSPGAVPLPAPSDAIAQHLGGKSFQSIINTGSQSGTDNQTYTTRSVPFARPVMLQTLTKRCRTRGLLAKPVRINHSESLLVRTRNKTIGLQCIVPVHV